MQKSIRSSSNTKQEFSINKESDKAIIFLRSFYKWYSTKFDYLDNHIYLVNTKKSVPYRIDFIATEKYLSILKSSGFFSDGYIDVYRKYFKSIDLKLQKTKQDDGPVDGLDYDFILHSQEPESDLKDLSIIQLNVVSSSTDNVIVKMKTKYESEHYQLFYLIKTNDKYAIDKIEFK